MRKLAVVLLCCLVVVGCKKKSEQEAAEDELIANATIPQVGTARDTAPPVATESVATASSAAPATSTTATATVTASTATTGSAATNVSNDLPWARPPVETSQPPPDIMVDTIYNWPKGLLPHVEKYYPNMKLFNTLHAEQWETLRQRQGWRLVQRIPIAADPIPPNSQSVNIFTNYPRVMIIYRRP